MNPFQKLQQFSHMETKRVIGLMSGMSMDGIDLAFAEIKQGRKRLDVTLLDHDFQAYTPELKQKLQMAIYGDISQACILNFAVAEAFAKIVNRFLADRKYASGDIDAIGSHGQTLYHQRDMETQAFTTLQVGDPSIICEHTGILTVGNFRIRDIASGGTGAPMVPLAEYHLFGSDQETVVCNNLGSISNVSVVTPQAEDMIAFDTGPANMASDFFMRKFYGLDFDRDGETASKGQTIEALLQKLCALPFFRLKPPRAAGYEDLGPNLINQIAEPFYSRYQPGDLVRTGLEWCVRTLLDAYERYVFPQFPGIRRILFSGGGAQNSFLMKRLAEEMKAVEVITLEKGMSDSKEALAFAILAHETLCGRTSSIANVTGAKASRILGEIAY